MDRSESTDIEDLTGPLDGKTPSIETSRLEAALGDWTSSKDIDELGVVVDGWTQFKVNSCLAAVFDNWSPSGVTDNVTTAFDNWISSITTDVFDMCPSNDTVELNGASTTIGCLHNTIELKDGVVKNHNNTYDGFNTTWKQNPIYLLSLLFKMDEQQCIYI